MNKNLYYERYDKQCERFYGKLGELTPLILNDEYLQVGDVVKLSDDDKERFIVKYDNQYYVRGFYPHGDMDYLKRLYNPKLVKKYYQVADGEEHGKIIMFDDDILEKEKEETKVKETITIEDCDECNCTLCNEDADFIIYLDEYYSDRDVTLCADCLANLGKKIIDTLR
jgi:hypothetical protein